MTSRRPYWCPKTMKRRPCWCPKPVLWELNSFLMQTLPFVPINLHKFRPREWKHSISEWYKDRSLNIYFFSLWIIYVVVKLSCKWPPSKSVFTHVTSFYANFWSKWECLHKKRVQLPRDWSGTTAWPSFLILFWMERQYGRCDVFWKGLLFYHAVAYQRSFS